MTKPYVISVLALTQPASAQGSAESGASGEFSLSVHAHSSQFTDTLFPTAPLETDFDGDSFSYSSIPCSFADAVLQLSGTFEDPTVPSG